MREINLYLEAVDKFNHVSYYRGHADSSWTLLPSIARRTITPETWENYLSWELLELSLMREFEKHGSSIIPKEPKNELEWLIHAQHHGLPTRLLDWSTNPLKALFFAVENPEHDNTDGVIYGVLPQLNYVMERFVKLGKHDQIIGFHSTSLNSRVVAQEGCFTVFPLPQKIEPFIELNTGDDGVEYLTSYVVPKEHKPALRRQLTKLGITHKFMFPDLDGLAVSIIRDFGL